MNRGLIVALILVSASAAPAFAQSSAGRVKAADVLLGYAGFIDDATIDHGIVGGSARIYLSPRIGVGPEVVYMRGPVDDRDLYLTGNLTFDILAPGPGRPVTPFLVAGGGVFHHTSSIGPQRFTNVEGAVTGGGGVRVRLNDRWYAVGEYRLGWEPHYRVNGGAGVTW
jgi:hypothetical protein